MDNLDFEYNEEFKKNKSLKNSIEWKKYNELIPADWYQVGRKIAVIKDFYQSIIEPTTYFVASKGAKDTFKSRDASLAIWICFFADRNSNFAILRKTYTQHFGSTFKTMISVLNQIEEEIGFKISNILQLHGSKQNCKIYFKLDHKREIRFVAYDQTDTISSSAFEFGYCKKIWFEEPVEFKKSIDLNEEEETQKWKIAQGSLLRGDFKNKQVIMTFNSWDEKSHYNEIYNDFPYNDELIINQKKYFDLKIDNDYADGLGKTLFRLHALVNPRLTDEDIVRYQSYELTDPNYFKVAVEGRDGLLLQDKPFPFREIFQLKGEQFKNQNLLNYEECKEYLNKAKIIRAGIDWGTNKFNSTAISIKCITHTNKILNLITTYFNFQSFQTKTNYANLIGWTMETLYEFCSFFRIRRISLVISHEQYGNVAFTINEKWNNFLKEKAVQDPEWFIPIELGYEPNKINLRNWNRETQLNWTIDNLLGNNYLWFDKEFDNWWQNIINIECEVMNENKLKIIEKANYQRLDVYDAEKMAELYFVGSVGSNVL